MVTVASKELKNRLGRYLQMVREGHPVQITDRGQPIGCILPLEKSDESVALAQLSRLLASGGLTLGSGTLRRRWKPAPLKPGPSITDMIAVDRR
jgi:prevent-host-death family protein